MTDEAQGLGEDLAELCLVIDKPQMASRTESAGGDGGARSEEDTPAEAVAKTSDPGRRKAGFHQRGAPAA